jgi:hypothetical protein
MGVVACFPMNIASVQNPNMKHPTTQTPFSILSVSLIQQLAEITGLINGHDP